MLNKEMQFLSWPYIEGQSAWGEQTTNGFCELDCYITPYIVEFINTLSNFAYVYLALRGIANTKRNGNDSTIILGYGMLFFVGVGSASFHMSVKYDTQNVDQVSMLSATVTILYGAFGTTLGIRARRALSLFLPPFLVSLSVANYYLGETKPFELCFASMVLMVFFQCLWMISTKVLETKVKTEMFKLAAYGAVAAVTGYLVWNLDFAYCSQLHAFRSVVGIPLGFATELHGWWHVLTGLAVYYYLVLIQYLRLYIRSARYGVQSKSQVNLVWTSIFALPHVEVMKFRGESIRGGAKGS